MTRRAGATRIEIGMVVVILAILGAIAYPRFAGDGRRRAAYDARSTLERLRDAQDAFLSSHRRYAADLDTAGVSPPPTIHVTIGGAGLGTGTGWSAKAVSVDPPGIECTIGVGIDSLAAPAPADGHSRDGVVTCR
jgi:type II secretory pathway pseudopilin PulG